MSNRRKSFKCYEKIKKNQKKRNEKRKERYTNFFISEKINIRAVGFKSFFLNNSPTNRTKRIGCNPSVNTRIAVNMIARKNDWI